jgi:hypothetical protein
MVSGLSQVGPLGVSVGPSGSQPTEADVQMPGPPGTSDVAQQSSVVSPQGA